MSHEEQQEASSVVDHRAHTPYSDPGVHRDRLAGLPLDPAELSAVARNVIVHYRAQAQGLPQSSAGDIGLRWIERSLEVDRRRHPGPLTDPRERTERLQGCCRDHTLLCVSVLRTHGVPARSRVGFVGYFVDGWHHDHVVVEAWLDGRWRRFDAELDGGLDGAVPDVSTPMDIPAIEASLVPVDRGFVTAAQVWSAHRAGALDAETYGVDVSVPLHRGERFCYNEVIHEVAHRFGDELLLWDGWGRMGLPGEPVSAEDAEWLDEVAALLLAADGGDLAAEQALLERYRAEPDLHPGPVIIQADPRGGPPVEASLRR